MFLFSLAGFANRPCHFSYEYLKEGNYLVFIAIMLPSTSIITSINARPILMGFHKNKFNTTLSDAISHVILRNVVQYRSQPVMCGIISKVVCL